VFFAPVIERPLQSHAKMYAQAGYIRQDVSSLSGRELGVAVAEDMFAFAKKIGFTTRLSEVDGFTNDHIQGSLTAAKNPQSKIKLENMPVPLSAEMIDEYIGPILESARDGDVSKIINVA
jgi:alcohol dehydrogenase